MLLAVPRLRRMQEGQAEEIRRNPRGKTVQLDDRLAQVDPLRTRWAGALGWALIFSLATVGAIFVAVSQHKSAFVGLAIYLSIPVPFFSWLAWRMRALGHRRP